MKQTEVTAKNINGVIFYIRPFAAFTAANISGELTSLISPILASLTAVFSGVKDSEKDKEFDIANVDAEKVIPMISGAFSSLSGDQIENITRKLLVQYNNISYEIEGENKQPQRLDADAVNEIFCGGIEDMFVLCYEVLRVNYSGFFGKIDSLYGKLKEAVKSSTKENTEGSTQDISATSK